MIVSKRFTFEAAHFIPGHDHCGRVHGHSYKMEIICEGTIGMDGMVVDFSEIKRIVNMYVVKELDHEMLNNIRGLELPTAENMCLWVKDRLVGKIPLKAVKIWETEDSYAEFRY